MASDQNRQLSLPKLGIGILALFSLVAIAFRLSPGWGLVVILAGMGLLGLAAWVFGFDSRDNADWD